MKPLAWTRVPLVVITVIATVSLAFVVAVVADSRDWDAGVIFLVSGIALAALVAAVETVVLPRWTREREREEKAAEGIEAALYTLRDEIAGLMSFAEELEKDPVVGTRFATWFIAAADRLARQTDIFAKQIAAVREMRPDDTDLMEIAGELDEMNSQASRLASLGRSILAGTYRQRGA